VDRLEVNRRIELDRRAGDEVDEGATRGIDEHEAVGRLGEERIEVALVIGRGIADVLPDRGLAIVEVHLIDADLGVSEAETRGDEHATADLATPRACVWFVACGGDRREHGAGNTEEAAADRHGSIAPTSSPVDFSQHLVLVGRDEVAIQDAVEHLTGDWHR
jgi:hypothetical protein